MCNGAAFPDSPHQRNGHFSPPVPSNFRQIVKPSADRPGWSCIARLLANAVTREVRRRPTTCSSPLLLFRRNSIRSRLFNWKALRPGAPLKGSNSFTEGQAKDRAIAWGATGVTGLTKDADGIWRGTSTMDGKPSNVAVDFKGNVVFTAAP